ERVAIGPVAEESVATLRETAGPSLDLVCALVALGQARLLAGDVQGGAGVLAEATAVARAVRPRYWITYALYWQGYVAQARREVAAGLRHVALPVQRVGDPVPRRPRGGARGAGRG